MVMICCMLHASGLSAETFYQVKYVNNNGDPANVKYAIFNEIEGKLFITQRGYIAPDTLLPAENCFVCVSGGAEFGIDVQNQTQVIKGSNMGYLHDFISGNKKNINSNRPFFVGVEEGTVHVTFLAPDGKLIASLPGTVLTGKKKGSQSAKSDPQQPPNILKFLDICSEPEKLYDKDYSPTLAESAPDEIADEIASEGEPDVNPPKPPASP